MPHSQMLQHILEQLSDLTPAELSEVKAAAHEKLEHHLRTIGANGALTTEEWQRLASDSLLGCVKMVRDRTGLGLVEAKAYVDRARAKGKTPMHTLSHDSGAGPQRDEEGHTLYCPRGCCDVPTGQECPK